MSEKLYRRTQVVWPGVVPLVFVSALLVWVYFEHDSSQYAQTPYAVGAGIGLAVLLVSLLLFGTLTVTVTDDALVASFGVGLVRKRLQFSDVVSFARVRTRWFNGWGIHGYPGGMLYNASGLSAVEFKTASGRYVAIGTGEPDALADAVRQATGKSESLAHEPAAQRRSRSIVVAIAIAGAALAFAGVMIYFGMQAPDVTLTTDALEVSSGMYSNTILYSAMSSATLENTIPRIGLKTNGFAAGNALRGSFNVDGWGNGRLYINRDVPPFVVVRVGRPFVVINFKDAERTRALYSDLTAHIDRRR